MTETATRTSADLLFPTWPKPLDLPPPGVLLSKSVAIKLTPAQMEAGRAAFMRQRRTLDDLYQFYDSDLAGFLRVIYRAMVRAG